MATAGTGTANQDLIGRGASAPFAFGLALMLVAPLHAQPAAVAELNGEVAFRYERVSYSWSTHRAYGVNGTVNLPIWSFVGGSLSAAGGRRRLDDDTYNQGLTATDGCGGHTWSAGGTLFLRDPTVGRIRATYQSGREACNSSFEPFAVDEYQYGADAEYYFPDWTVAAAVMRSAFKDSYFNSFTRQYERVRLGSNRYSIGASFYPTSEWRVGAKLQRWPGSADVDLYGVAFEYQPGFLGNRYSLAFTYDRGEYDVNVYGVRLTVFFGAQPDLKTRDRYYR